MPKSEQYKEAARIVETAVRKLGKLPPPALRLPGAPAASPSAPAPSTEEERQ